MRLFRIKYLFLTGLILFLFLSVKASSDETELARLANDFSNSALSTSGEVATEKSIDLQAESAVVSELPSGKTVFTLNSEKRWPLASLTKLMTSVVALKLMPPGELIPITAEAVLTEGPTGGFSEGERFELQDLIKAMLLVSSNDAAKAVALHYDEERFVQVMNAEAKDLGMKDTSFVDSSGLSPKNLGTARDLEKLIGFIFSQNRELLEITRAKSGVITDITTGETRNLSNINSFAGRSEFLGGKTGTMPQAGGNLISVFDINGPKAIIVLGAGDKFMETEKIIDNLWPRKK